MKERIAIAADHAGISLKSELCSKLRDEGYEVDDLGTHSAEAVDYPDYAQQVARAISKGRYQRGILICGTGVGMAIAANRFAGIRAVNCGDTFTARSSRQHNDSNVIALGSRVLGSGLAWEVLSTWLATPFSADQRHARRVAKIDNRQE